MFFLKKSQTFSLLKRKDFRLLFSVQVFSSFGTWLDLLAINALISFQWGLDLRANAASVIVMFLPYIVIGPLSSVWIDRWDQKKVMMVSTLFRVMVILGFFVTPNIWVLLALIFLKSSLASVFEPARQSSTRKVVPNEYMAEASALSQIVVNVTKIVAPLIGGGLLVLTKPQMIFLIEGIMYGMALMLIFKLPAFEKGGQENCIAKASYWVDFKEGFSLIRSNRLLLSAISITSISMFIIFLYDSFFAPLSLSLGLDKTGYGLISSALGAGSVTGSFLCGTYTNWRKNPLRFMSIGRIISGVFMLLVGLGCYGFVHGNLLFWMIVFAMIGCVGTALFVPYGFILTSETPSNMLGRVSAFSTAVQSASSLLAPVIGSLLGKWLGLASVFTVSAVTFILLGSVSLFITNNKKSYEKKNLVKEQA